MLPVAAYETCTAIGRNSGPFITFQSVAVIDAKILVIEKDLQMVFLQKRNNPRLHLHHSPGDSEK